MGGERHPAADQQDRCSAQKHLWRRQRGGHMACQCGAVHPNDLEAFLAGYLAP